MHLTLAPQRGEWYSATQKAAFYLAVTDPSLGAKTPVAGS